MSQPAQPPPYNVIYTQGMPAHPIQAQPQGHAVIQVTQPVYRVGGVVSMGIEPATIVCHSCNHMVVTKIQVVPVLRTHACAFCMCFFGLWPCCFLPYCMPSCNNVDHYCPTCNAFIGSYKG